MIHVYFAAPEPYWEEYQVPLRRALDQTVQHCPQSKGFAAPMLVCAKPYAAPILT